MTSQLIDVEAAREFMKETLDRVERSVLISIANDLGEKSSYFQRQLSAQQLPNLSQEEVSNLLDRVFATKRKSKEILKLYPLEKLKESMFALLYGESPVENRFQAFTDQLEALDVNIRFDLAGELLHYHNPDKYWLWCRWMWDPKTKTGALPLVASEGFDLQGEDFGQTYLKVGRGVAFVNAMAEAADFRFISRSLFGTNVFLSCVYVVYAYTVLRMRMTKEFNKVMPGVSEFSRRLLGVYKISQPAN